MKILQNNLSNYFRFDKIVFFFSLIYRKHFFFFFFRPPRDPDRPNSFSVEDGALSALQGLPRGNTTENPTVGRGDPILS